MKNKLLALVLLANAFSCGFYLKIPERRIEQSNEKKISSKLVGSVPLTITNNNIVYFIEDNQIKKIDENNKLSLVLGKREADIYPEDGVIDGNINSAKFGKISELQYLESEKEIYFVDIIGNNFSAFSFIRKITKDNYVKTVFKLEFSQYEILSNRNSIFILTPFEEKKIIKIDSNDKITKKELPLLSFEDTHSFIIDSEENIYFTQSIHEYKSGNEIYSIHKLYNNQIVEICSSITNKNILLDENDSLYIIEDPKVYKGRTLVSGFNDPIFFHKIMKSNLKARYLNYDLSNKKYVIGNFPQGYRFIKVNYKTNTLFLDNYISLFKINLENQKP